MMSGTKESADVLTLNERMEKFGDGWYVLGNEPDNPHCVVANSILKIVTQIFDKNYELEGWMRHKWYHPNLSVEELKAKRKMKRAERISTLGMFGAIKPSIKSQQEWYRNYVERRLIKKTDE
jgi:hypothetical protein